MLGASCWLFYFHVIKRDDTSNTKQDHQEPLFYAFHGRQSIVLVNIGSLPRIANPNIWDGDGSQVSIVIDHIIRQMALLLLVFVVQNKYRKLGLFRPSLFFSGFLDIFFQFFDGVLERGACVIDFVDYEDVLANQVGHLQGRQVEPLCSCDFGAGGLDRVGTGELLVEGKTDGLDRNIGGSRLFEEGSGIGLGVRVCCGLGCVDSCIRGWKGWMIHTLEFEQEHSHLHQWRS